MQLRIGFVLLCLVLMFVGSHCTTEATTRKTRSGYRKLDRREIEEEELRVLAQFAASTLAKAEKKPYHDTVLNITEAHQQTVAGWNTKMRLLMTETGCPIRSRFDAAHCPPKNGTIPRSCDVVVYERPWEHIKELTSYYCHEQQSSNSTTV
ncbi:uncharacterized protein LOC100897344 [Galendromus occidentalis]|uniref:Uncharacterized protein LOC100897344 n=1 Tax=Galendromus occidentalis TaxID=34638 RepID=A0AAJ6VYD2_9ACAR|nr:uncharacterized protein LOC100897344 [Galendromus occidentalis]